MRSSFSCLAAAALAVAVLAPVAAQPGRQSASTAPGSYFPTRFEWRHQQPEQVGMNAAVLQEAVQLAIAGETTGPKDMAQFLTNGFGREPFFSLIGPIKDRGGASGLIVRRGSIVAE